MYYLFHMFVETTTVFPAYTRFYYSLIDMSQNNGQGKVIEKNIPLLTGNHLLNYNQATTVRHANGRDWWLIVPNHMGPEYYRFLLTPDGIEGPWMQEIGFKEYTDDITASFWGQRTFSPDGSKFADYDFLNYTQVFDFDRCTGLLSNPYLLQHNLDPVLNNGVSGIAFSPSGRFLYMTRTNNGYSLYQYDTDADDILASEIEIDHCPLVNQQFECAFANILLAPDNKIYIAGDTISYHVIHEPDSLGQACDLERGGLVFPLAYPNSWFPYFPNYRLGPLEGSVCDSLVSSSGEVGMAMQDLQVSPNPASSFVEISFRAPSQVAGKQATIILYNQLGQAIAFRQVGGTLDTPHRIDVSNLPPGLYNVALQLEGTLMGAARFMVKR